MKGGKLGQFGDLKKSKNCEFLVDHYLLKVLLKYFLKRMCSNRITRVSDKVSFFNQSS